MREIKTEEEFSKYYCKPEYERGETIWKRIKSAGMRVYIMDKEEKEYFDATKRVLDKLDIDTKNLIEKSGGVIGYRCMKCRATFHPDDLRGMLSVKGKRKCYYCGANLMLSDIYGE